MKTTPEIQARIERLTREHPPAKGMEWRAMPPDEIISNGDMFVNSNAFLTKCQGARVARDFGRYFRQVPAEAKEEQRLADYKEWLQSRAHLEEGQEIGAGFDPDGPSQKEPGLDYERLFEVLPENVKYYTLAKSGMVYGWEREPSIHKGTYVWEWRGASMWNVIAASYVLRNLPADWTQSLRVREPKPEPDVEPDEETPWGTPVEVRHDKAAWMEAIYLGRSNGFAWAAAKGDLMPRAWVRCRLRREGK